MASVVRRHIKSAQVGAVITKDTRHGELVAPEEFVARLHAGQHAQAVA
jgi:hypothetical protein